MPSLDRLSLFGLPNIRTVEDFSNHIHISTEEIFVLSTRTDLFYKTFFVPKKNGTRRMIAMPAPRLKLVQAWILYFILNKISTSHYSFGFEPRSNILHNASVHAGAKAVQTMDLKDFFHSVKREYVYGIFREIGYPKFIATIFSRLCTFKGFLPQGGPCSPKLANLYCLRLDKRLNGFAIKRGLLYSRYADDLTFSASMPIRLKGITHPITLIVRDENLTINAQKTRLSGSHTARKVTGLVLYDNKVGIGKKLYRVIRAKINNLYKLTIPHQAEQEILSINGWLSYIKSVDPVRHERLGQFLTARKSKLPNDNLEKLKFN